MKAKTDIKKNQLANQKKLPQKQKKMRKHFNDINFALMRSLSAAGHSWVVDICLQ